MNISSFVGIPYETKNCWDLAVDFYDKILGISLKHIYNSGITPDRFETKNLIFTNMGEVEEVSTPSFGDIIILKIFGVEAHIAICVGEGKMLHTSKASGSVIDRIKKWEKQIVGFYRVKNK